MAKAGFTTIWSGEIVFRRDGTWACDGEPISNPAICRLYARSMTVEPDGRGRLVLGEDRAFVRIEDTPWVVRSVDRRGDGQFDLVLNDDSREPLDPTTLSVGDDEVLYCRAKQGHRVRFLRPAYYELTRDAETDADGRIVVRVADRPYPLTGRSTAP